MNILAVGDVCSVCGCEYALKQIPRIRREENIDMVIVNGENSAVGNGITPQSAEMLFAAGAALFFTKAAALPYKVAYPVLLLAVAVFCLRRKTLLPVGTALLLSALGDAAGAKGLFIPQMLFFALAHGAYIRYFLCAGGLPARPAAWLLALLFAGVVPRVLDPAERIGVAVYGAVIAGMLYSVLRYRGAYAAWFRFAALLFVFSDGVIAWSRFIGAVPGRTYVVMVPYYLAQCLFFCFAVKSLPALPSEGRSV